MQTRFPGSENLVWTDPSSILLHYQISWYVKGTDDKSESKSTWNMKTTYQRTKRTKHKWWIKPNILPISLKLLWFDGISYLECFFPFFARSRKLKSLVYFCSIVFQILLVIAETELQRWEFLKRIVRLKTPSTYKPDELFPPVQHVSNIIYNSNDRTVNFEYLTKLVTSRLQTLRTERFSTQVEAFANEFRVKASPETDYANFFDLVFRHGWNTCKVGSWTDGKMKSKLHKALLDYREGKSARKPRGAPFNPNLE